MTPELLSALRTELGSVFSAEIAERVRRIVLDDAISNRALNVSIPAMTASLSISGALPRLAKGADDTWAVGPCIVAFHAAIDALLTEG